MTFYLTGNVPDRYLKELWELTENEQVRKFGTSADLDDLKPLLKVFIKCGRMFPDKMFAICERSWDRKFVDLDLFRLDKNDSFMCHIVTRMCTHEETLKTAQDLLDILTESGKLSHYG